MNGSLILDAARRTPSRSTLSVLLLAVAATLVCLLAVAARPGVAHAAYNITDFQMNPSSLQAGGHPNVMFRIDPDATLADQVGDDLKKVVYEFPAGALGNPEAAVNTKCTDAQYNSDRCPTGSFIGSMSTKLRLKIGSSYTTLNAPGSMYVMAPVKNTDPIEIGFIIRPTGYRFIFMKSAVTGVVAVRSGIDADYGLTMVFDNIPRTLTTTWGSTVQATLMDFVANLNSRTKTDRTGPVFTYMPTRCDVATARATITSYNGVSLNRQDTFEPTGCANVPFNPTTSYTFGTTQAGASTSVEATFNVPFVLAGTNTSNISHSHVRNIVADLPQGTGIDFPALSAVPATCTEAQVEADTCPAGAKIGSVRVNVPFMSPLATTYSSSDPNRILLPPGATSATTMHGDVYLINRNNGIVFGYVLRGNHGIKATLKGQVITVDSNGDGSADFIRAIAQTMPQAPWTQAKINFTSALIKNPQTCGTNTISTNMIGWAGTSDSNTAPGKNKVTTNTYTTTGCSGDTQAPIVTITSPANNTNTTAASIPVTYTVTDNVDPTPTCNIASGSSVALNTGANTITVSCTDDAGNTGSASVTVNRGSLPVVVITSPANGASSTASSINVSYTVNGGTTIPSGTTCTVNGVASTSTTSNTVALTVGANNLTVSCTNAFGAGTASISYTRLAGTAPAVAITSPANNTNTTASSINVAYTVNGATTIPSGTTCTVNGTSSTSTSTNSVALVVGTNTITVACTNSTGTGSASVTVNRGTAPTVAITSPANNTSTTASSINVAFTVNGGTTIPSATSCTVNGTGTTSTSTNSVALVTGNNTITVSCSNSFGSGSASVTVVRGGVPTVAITSPANNTSTTATSINVSYTVNGGTTIPSGTTCTVNGAASTSTSTNSVALVVGANTITVSCANSFGTGTPATVTVNRGTAPAVAITSPANNTNTTATSINVAYTVNGGTTIPSGITCTVNGAASTSTSTNSVSLVVGANTITVSCANSFGAGSASVTVNRGGVPVVAITSPANNTNTTATSINVAYTVNGATTIPSGTTCTVNGAASTTPSTNSVALVVGANTITVSCANSFGTSTPATVTVNRGTAPTVAITSPANNTNTTATSINVAYTVNAGTTIPSGTTCTVNGASSTSTSTNSVALVVGANTITVACTNAFGTGSASVTVNRGGVPVVVITSPINNTNTTASSINVAYTVNGSATLPSGTTCTVNGVASTGGTTNTVSLNMGANTITVSCTNSFGTGTAAATVNRGSVPAVVITSPANNSTATTSPINVAYTVNGSTTIPSGTTCTVRGTASTSTTTNSVTLTAGANSIPVACTNAFGTGSATVTVNFGNVPAVAITSPANNTNTTATSINVAYTVGGATTIPSGTTCTVNGTASTTPSTNSVNLAVGANTITVACTNSFGTGNATVTVNRGSAPAVVVTSPVNNTNTTAATINIAYTVNGATTIPSGTTCTVNGAPSTTPSTNSVNLAIGANTITVSCTNAFGAGTASVTVNRGTVPTVAITSPANNTNTTATSINVAYTVNGGTTIPSGTTCTVNGAASTSTSANSVSLVVGANTITVSCTNAFGTSTPASVTVNRGTAPVVAITSPANNTNTTATSINVAYTVGGSTTIPSGTTCTVNGAASTSATTNSVALVVGANTITVSCTNAFGTSTPVSVTVNRGSAPAVVITSPANNTSTTASINIAYTVGGATTIPSGTTCTVNGTASTTPSTNTVTLAVGANTITVACTNSFGTGSAVITVNRTTAEPTTTITSFANPSAGTPPVVDPTHPASPALTVQFTGTNQTGFECRVDAGAFAACTSPWTVPVTGLTSPAQHTYDVRAVNGSTPDSTPVRGHFWYDNRAFTAVPTVAAVANSLEPTAADANDAGAHPNISATLSLEGWDDPQTATVVGPDGLMGSLKSIPVANRCTLSQANAGTCPATALIGTAVATATSTTDGTVTANGNIYLVDPGPKGGFPTNPNSIPDTDAAGVAVEFENITGPITGNLGNVIATGGMRVNDQARNLRIVINNIPRQTSTGNRFHLRSGSLTINGDTRPNMGAAISDANPPLITNQHTCVSPGAHRPNYNQFVGTGTGFGGSVTPSITATYTVDNCAAIPFAPAVTYSSSVSTAGAGTVLTTTATLPFDNSTIRAVSATLPPFLAANTAAFGDASVDQCPVETIVNASTSGPVYNYFDFENPSFPCPAQARVGTASVVSPLLDGTVTGTVWLIEKAPIPNMGIAIDADTAGNPKGVNIGIIATTATVQYVATCDPLFETCDQAIQAVLNSLPDVPMSSVQLVLGTVPGRLDNLGNPLQQHVVKNAAAADSVCRNAGDNVRTSLVPWRGTPNVALTQLLQPTGCAQ